MSSRTRAAAAASLAAAAAFPLLLLAAHVVNPQVDPSWVPVSQYVLERHGYLMTLAFLSWGASALLLAFALAPAVSGWGARVGLGLLMLGATGPLLASVAPSDPIGTPMEELSTTGVVHSLAAVLGDFVPLAALVLAYVSVDGAWGPARRSVRVAAWVAFGAVVVSSVALGVMMPPDGQLGPDVQVGWLMRGYALASVAWVAVASRALYASPTS